MARRWDCAPLQLTPNVDPRDITVVQRFVDYQVTDVRAGRSNSKRGRMKYTNLVLVLSVVLFGCSTISFLYLSTTGSTPAPMPNKAIDDQVQQYTLAVRAGSQEDRCVQAGFVASAYIQAKDEPNYQAWSGIRNSECSAAGIAR